MKKLVLLFLVWLGCGVNAFSQSDPVLLRVNGEVVTRSEFEYSFHKNNSMAMLEKKTPEEFLDLYIDYKLKVSAARSAGMDTTQSFKEELASYRRFLAKSYLTDTAAEEEQARKLYDDMKNSVSVSQVQVMHIFKYLPQNASAAAIRNASSKMDSIYRLLRN
ncbi:MAG TPA: peptidylprolyl isomerase, partial [Bacteroides graminisolvens]|nr:peptidylprolyl isomerase [Bacteroides graminisolvens]